jgi:GT2 family glycosyltransferase
MNPVLILTHNCLELTKKCVESVRKQDIETSIYVFDNASHDGTQEWLERQVGKGFGYSGSIRNEGVSRGWNLGFSYLFEHMNADYVLCPNNDTILSPSAYRELLSYDVPFVTGASTENMLEISPMIHHERQPLVGGPDFSCFLIRRDCWEKVGPFDERMKFYASDNAFHVEAHRKGIELLRANLPFYHERSSTLKKASPAERREIEIQADRDREVFKSIYGCMPWEPGYQELFK